MIWTLGSILANTILMCESDIAPYIHSVKLCFQWAVLMYFQYFEIFFANIGPMSFLEDKESRRSSYQKFPHSFLPCSAFRHHNKNKLTNLKKDLPFSGSVWCDESAFCCVCVCCFFLRLRFLTPEIVNQEQDIRIYVSVVKQWGEVLGLCRPVHIVVDKGCLPWQLSMTSYCWQNQQPVLFEV